MNLKRTRSNRTTFNSGLERRPVIMRKHIGSNRTTFNSGLEQDELSGLIYISSNRTTFSSGLERHSELLFVTNKLYTI